MTQHTGTSTVTPSELQGVLRRHIEHEIFTPLMVWGPPGIGKSSIVRQVAQEYQLNFVDVRLPQLAPLDLRGIPSPREVEFRNFDGSEQVTSLATTYAAPEFMPRTKGNLILWDEINMAAPVMMGLAQQALLDRRIGDYVMPQRTFQVACGNRKVDRAAVNTMPSPVANRLNHVSLVPHLEDFLKYALSHRLHDQVIAFLNFRPTLLHDMTVTEAAWPSPRTWEQASALHEAGLNIAFAVGEGVAAEFYAFTRLYHHLPNIKRVLAGAARQPFPEALDQRYAVVVAAASLINTPQQLSHFLTWMTAHSANDEFLMVLAKTMHMKNSGEFARLWLGWAKLAPQNHATLSKLGAAMQLK